MAKINFDQILKDARGEPIAAAGGDPEKPEAATLKLIAMNALLTPLAGDAEIPTLNYRLYTLVHRLVDGGEVDLDAAQIQMIKGRIERVYPPWIVGCTWDMLDSRTAPVDLPPLDVGAHASPQHRSAMPQRLPGDAG